MFFFFLLYDAQVTYANVKGAAFYPSVVLEALAHEREDDQM